MSLVFLEPPIEFASIQVMISNLLRFTKPGLLLVFNQSSQSKVKLRGFSAFTYKSFPRLSIYMGYAPIYACAYVYFVIRQLVELNLNMRIVFSVTLCGFARAFLFKRFKPSNRMLAGLNLSDEDKALV